MKKNRLIYEIFSAPLVQIAVLSMVLAYFVMAFLMVITPVHMDNHNHGATAISGVIMAHTMGMFGLSGLTGWLIDRFGRIRMIYAGVAVLISGCITAPLSTQVPILGLALFLIGLGWNFAFVSGSSLLSDALNTRERARGQAAVAFSPDGKYALSGFDDGTLKLWDIETGSCLRTLTKHTSGVSSVAFSPDGRYALSGSDDGTLKVWALDWELEARELADWDEGARVYVENFLTRQTPYAGTLPQDREPTEEEIRLALTRRGEPKWTEEEFQRLIRELQGAGYGWLREEGVRAWLMRIKIERGW